MMSPIGIDYIRDQIARRRLAIERSFCLALSRGDWSDCWREIDAASTDQRPSLLGPFMVRYWTRKSWELGDERCEREFPREAGE